MDRIVSLAMAVLLVVVMFAHYGAVEKWRKAAKEIFWAVCPKHGNIAKLERGSMVTYYCTIDGDVIQLPEELEP